MIVKGGSVDVTTYFSMRLSATGLDATGLTMSDFDMQYTRSVEVPTAKVDCVALAATNTAHTDNRGIEVDATDQPGLYRFDWPDAAFVAGTTVILSIKHTSCFTEHLRIELFAFDPRDGVRLGLTALPNAAAEAAGGLYTRGTGAGQINQPANGMADTNVVRNAGTAITAAAGIQEVKVASLAASAITATSIAADAITDAKVASDVTIASVTGAVGSVTGAVGSIAAGGIATTSFAAGAINAAAIAADAIGASELAADAVAEIADAVWDEAIAGHLGAGSTGLALNSAGAAGDPWSTALPGAYGAGTAGKIVGDNVNATISSRASQTSLDTVDDLIDIEIADIQARLPAALSAGGWMKSDIQTILAGTTGANYLARLATGTLNGTADSGTTTTMVDTALTQAADVFAGNIIVFCSGTNVFASRVISSFTPGTDTVTWAEALPNAVTTENYIILPLGIKARFDAIDTAVADLPTNAELATSQAAADDATLAAIAALTIPTAAANADAVWDEAIAGHVGAGSTGEALSAAGGAGDPWITALPGAYGAGTAGKILGDNINATISSRASQTSVDTVQADTDNIQTRLPTALVSGRMDSSAGAIASGAITATAIAANAIGASELAADAVTEIADAVWVVAARTLTANTNFNDLNAAAVRAAIGLAAADLDTQLAELPTNAELATSQASADDATLAAIAALNDLSAAELATALGTADDAILAILGTPAGASIAADIAGISAGSGLDAAGVRAAIGMAAADLDTQIDGIVAGSGLDAAGVRAALGMAAPNLDTQLTTPIAVNITRVNGIDITGLGTREFPWKPV